MEYEYSFKLEKLESNFNNLLLFSKKLDQEKLSTNNLLKHFKDTHTNLSKTSNKQIFVFCLDSFLFQYKVFSMEIDNLNKTHSMIKNRMYCDYYKLYKMLLKYISTNFSELNIHVNELPNVPVYKDLEPTYDYGYTNIEQIHKALLDSIRKITTVYLKKLESIREYKANSNVGFGISNFINTMNHEKDMLKGKIDLYIDYVSFFNISQFKYMKRLHVVFNEFDRQLKNTANDDQCFSFQDILDEKNGNIMILDEMNDLIPKKDENNLEKDENNLEKGENNINPDSNDNKDKSITRDNKEDVNALIKKNESDIPVFQSIETTEKDEK
tara:strand:+ start:853 stop:1830 length:978 start_codon:yes stop_codon:yes gene_type:complete